MTDNNVTLVGNLTRDPELRYTPAGQAQCTFGIAVNKRWTDRTTGEKKESTSYFNIIAWAETAENVGESCTKGMRVIVVGEVEQRSWETPDGEKRSTVEIKASSIGPDLRWATAQVQKTNRSSNGGGQQQGQQQQRPAPQQGDDPFAGEEPF